MFPLRDSTPSKHFPLVTIMLIMINTFIFIYTLSLGMTGMQEVFYIFGLVPAYYAHPAGAPIGYFSFVTSVFLHGGWMHLIANMWILWLFGDNVEDHMGSGRFLLFYMLCGIAAGLTHYYVNPLSNIPVVGASGAVAGVMGAYFLMFRHARILTYVPPFFLFTVPAWVYLGFWALSQLWSGATELAFNYSASIAFWAHFGGFVAGMILHFFFVKKEQTEYFP
jgi:membrane associated rhomboid family serine protease